MLKERLMEDLKQSMKDKNVLRKNVIQMIRAAILQVEKDKQIELDDNQVLEIINLLINTTLSYKEIADRYNVSYNTIDLINRCKIWCHLHNYTDNIRNTAIKKINPIFSSRSGEYSHSNKITEQQAIEIIELLKNDSRSLA